MTWMAPLPPVSDAVAGGDDLGRADQRARAGRYELVVTTAVPLLEVIPNAHTTPGKSELLAVVPPTTRVWARFGRKLGAVRNRVSPDAWWS